MVLVRECMMAPFANHAREWVRYQKGMRTMISHIRFWVAVAMYKSILVTCWLIGGVQGWADYINPCYYKKE